MNQFRFRDFTVLTIMLAAIIAGGLGVCALHGTGHAQYQIKPANLLGVGMGRLYSESEWCLMAAWNSS